MPGGGNLHSNTPDNSTLETHSLARESNMIRGSVIVIIRIIVEDKINPILLAFDSLTHAYVPCEDPYN